jgi:glycerophosphoryl diester phosphodiesterase
VIGHRGASGHRPEHTLAAYALAARLGADHVEPDLVSTADGCLVARHEPEISGTTDVAGHPEFAGRRTSRLVDGTRMEGWFTEDFTLAELKTLRARERIPDLRPGNVAYDGRSEIPTFQEVVDLVKALSEELQRPIGLYPETKHPTCSRRLGLPLEPALIRTLRDNGLDRPDAPVFLQSFEVSNLRALREELRVPLVQLLDRPERLPFDVVAAGGATTYGDMATAEGLREVARYADGVGPAKSHIVPRLGDGSSGTPTSFVEHAHAAGLLVHPWTFRAENRFLPRELRVGDEPGAYGEWLSEFRQFFELGVDGIFTDHPGKGVSARDAAGR